MTTEANIAVVRRFHEAFGRGDIQAALECIAEDATNHGRPVGRAGYAATLGDIRNKFPDCALVIDELVAAGDHVVVRATYSGTHLGQQRIPMIDGGLLFGVAPTGRHFSVHTIHWYLVQDGYIRSHFANRDDVDMMVQLGLLSRTGPAPTG